MKYFTLFSLTTLLFFFDDEHFPEKTPGDYLLPATVHAGKPTYDVWDQQEQVKQHLIRCEEGTVCAEVGSAHVSLHAHIREGEVDLGAQTDGAGAHTPVGAV